MSDAWEAGSGANAATRPPCALFNAFGERR